MPGALSHYKIGRLDQLQSSQQQRHSFDYFRLTLLSYLVEMTKTTGLTVCRDNAVKAVSNHHFVGS